MKINLKEIMEERNMTITQLHLETGLSRATITPLVNQTRNLYKTRIETIEILCIALGVEVNELVTIEIPKEIKELNALIAERKKLLKGLKDEKEQTQ